MRRIVTHREQAALMQRWADNAVDATTTGVSECDPSDPTCRAKTQDKPANPATDSPDTSPAANTFEHRPATTSTAPGAPSSVGGPRTTPSVGGGGSSGGHGGGTPGGGPPSQNLTQALQRAGIDPVMYPMISGFSATEGNNPSGAPTLGFTDSQAGSTLDEHAQALSKQFRDRASVSGPFPHGGTPAEQASWMATTVGQNGSPSDWQGNAQPARSTYVDNIVKSMPTSAPAPAVTPPRPTALPAPTRPGTGY